jgi:hypothetical protein
MNVVVTDHIWVTNFVIVVFVLFEIVVVLEVEILANEFVFMSKYVSEEVFVWVNLKDVSLLAVLQREHQVFDRY